MTILGYIVQYSNETDYTVYHGFAKLYRNFSDALQHATNMYTAQLELYVTIAEGPTHVHKPTKKECDERGSAVVFESVNFIVWIDCVVE